MGNAELPRRKRSPHAFFHELSTGTARWTDGFWADRFVRCASVTIPGVETALRDVGNGAVLDNFASVAGVHRPFVGAPWSDGDCYKWMEAVFHASAVTGDASLLERAERWIPVIASAQEHDGYICTQVQLGTQGRWSDKLQHELYNLGHLFTAAAVHHRTTGRSDLLDVALRAADCVDRTFRARHRELIHFCYNPSQIMGLIDLYRATGKQRHLDLAAFFIANRGAATADWDERPGWRSWVGGDCNQDRVPLRQETLAVGHAVTAEYLYCGAADLVAETGDPELAQALGRIWDDLLGRKVHVTGGTAGLRNGLSLRDQKVQHGGDLVHEAIANAFVLPTATAYNETCGNIGLAMWGWRMLRATGDARFADAMEQVMFNHLLSGIDLGGDRFFYTNPLRWYGPDHVCQSLDSHGRWSRCGCYCCPPQVARTLASLQDWVYGLGDDGLWVHHYGSSRVETGVGDQRLLVEQTSNYPWEGSIRLSLESYPHRVIRLRIPGWTLGQGPVRVRINGQEQTIQPVPGRYLELNRDWRPGDIIELELPMTVRLLLADRRVEELHNQGAIIRGPMVYCLEGVDLPDGTALESVHIPGDFSAQTLPGGGVLAGMTVLTGRMRIIEREVVGEGLYRALAATWKRDIQATLIPYFVWANRGDHPMSVWLPLAE